MVEQGRAMSDFERAKKVQLQFEDCFRRVLGVQGKTFHELINALKDNYSKLLIDDLHWIKKERNALAHEERNEFSSRSEFEFRAARAHTLLMREFAKAGADVGFAIVNKHSKKCLDVAWDMTQLRVHQWGVTGWENQQWSLRKVEGGAYLIQSLWNGRCLDVDSGSHEESAGVSVWRYEASANQQWWLHKQDDGSYIIQARHSEQCLDVRGASQEDGASVAQYPWHGHANQRWWLTAGV